METPVEVTGYYDYQRFLDAHKEPNLKDVEFYWFTTIASGIGRLKMSEKQANESLITLEPMNEIHN